MWPAADDTANCSLLSHSHVEHSRSYLRHAGPVITESTACSSGADTAASAKANGFECSHTWVNFQGDKSLTAPPAASGSRDLIAKVTGDAVCGPDVSGTAAHWVTGGHVNVWQLTSAAHDTPTVRYLDIFPICLLGLTGQSSSSSSTNWLKWHKVNSDC